MTADPQPYEVWERWRLADLLRPFVDGRSVLDLGCGDGWVADALHPSHYTGLDRVKARLSELQKKHHDAATLHTDVRGAAAAVGEGVTYETVLSVWGAHLFPNDLVDGARLVKPGGYLALHGAGVAYLNAERAKKGEREADTWRVGNIRTLLPDQKMVLLAGTGATTRGPYGYWSWAARNLPVERHHGILAVWQIGAP